MLIYYTVEQLREFVGAKASLIRRLTTLGILPCVPDVTPYRFEYYTIKQWIADGGVEKHIQEFDHSDYIME